jgi:hypothetical protein
MSATDQISWIGVDTLAERVVQVVDMATNTPDRVDGKAIHLVRAPVSLADIMAQYIALDVHCGDASATKVLQGNELKLVPLGSWKDALRAHVAQAVAQNTNMRRVSDTPTDRIETDLRTTGVHPGELASKWETLCSVPHGLDGVLGLCERPLVTATFPDTTEASLSDLLSLATVLLQMLGGHAQ